MTGNFLHTNDERLALKQLEKSLDIRVYRDLLKIIKIYTLNIISRKEALSLINKIGLDMIHYDNLR